MNGMNAAAYQMLGAAQGVAGGKLNGVAELVATMQQSEIQFEASAKVAAMQSAITGAAIDMLA